jgi:hypothetical protein
MFRRIMVGAVLFSLACQAVPVLPHAHAGYFRDRDFFVAEVDDDFHIRGRCWISKGRGGVVVDALNRLLKLAGENDKDRTSLKAPELPPGAKDIFPELGDAKCIVKKRKHAHGIIRASGTVTTIMHNWAATPSGLQMARRTTETCTGKDRCDTTLSAAGAHVVGVSACIEARQGSDLGSHVITVGKVPAAIAAGKGYRDNVQCSARAF